MANSQVSDKQFFPVLAEANKLGQDCIWVSGQLAEKGLTLTSDSVYQKINSKNKDLATYYDACVEAVETGKIVKVLNEKGNVRYEVDPESEAVQATANMDEPNQLPVLKRDNTKNGAGRGKSTDMNEVDAVFSLYFGQPESVEQKQG